MRAAEDILSLTRKLKEAWLFGRLDTSDDSGTKSQIEQHVRQVEEDLVWLGVEVEKQ